MGRKEAFLEANLRSTNIRHRKGLRVVSALFALLPLLLEHSPTTLRLPMRVMVLCNGLHESMKTEVVVLRGKVSSPLFGF